MANRRHSDENIVSNHNLVVPLPMIRFENVSKSFGRIDAIKDVSFTIDPGEFVFLTGNSGAGKTTILRLILGEIMPTTGEITIDGTTLTSLKGSQIPKHRQSIGTVFQDFKLLVDKTVTENVEIALAVVGVGQKEWQGRVDRVLELVGLSDRANLFPAQLSGGEAQRVALARALITNPKVILADEPTGNLDWDTAESIVKLIERINHEGKTIVFATHHQGILDKLKKRTIHMEKGKVTKA